MIGQTVFFASGPVEVSGNTLSTNTGNLGTPSSKYSNLYLTGTGFADEFSARKTSLITGEITGLSVSNLYPIGQPDLGHLNLRWRNTYTTGTGYFDRLITREISAQTGQITGLSVSNLYPVGQPNLGHPSQKWNNSYLTGTGYSYSQEVIYNGQSEEVITRAEVTGKFIPKYITGNHPVQFNSGEVTGLSFSLAANKTYKLQYHLQYSGSSNTEGISVSVSGTNSVVFFAGDGAIDDFNGTPETFVITGYGNHGHFHGSVERKPITMNILVVNSSTANVLSLYAGKETTGINAVAVCGGSWATLTQY